MTKPLVEFPAERGLSQDEEWCTVTVDGQQRTLRFHEYGAIFSIPGLYEELFYARLKCNSPRTLSTLLSGVLKEHDVTPASLKVIDLGAGNGMMGEELQALGVAKQVAVDILPEAAAATQRDRPGVYLDYVVGDLTRPTADDKRRLTVHQPNLLVTIAALGFGDIPSMAFVEAWNLIATPGWVVFNIKQEFLDPKYDYGFSELVRRLEREDLLKIHRQVAYQHRLALDGRPLPYVAFVGQKKGAIPEAWFPSIQEKP